MSEYVIEIPDYVLPFEPFASAAKLGEEIIRCRDCEHYYEAEEYHPQGNYNRRCCKYFGAYDDEVDPNGFCAWGKRRDA